MREAVWQRQVRERLVHSMEATPLEDDPNGLMLRMRTQVLLFGRPAAVVPLF